MKTDLPNLMRQRQLDAVVVSGPDGMSAANPNYNYLIAPAHDISGHIIVKADGSTYLLHRTMERDEAAQSGLKLINYDSYNRKQIIADKNGDRLAAEVELWRRIFADLKIDGRVGFYGSEDQGKAYAFLNALAREEVCEVVTEFENDALLEARATKDTWEAEQIVKACRATEQVMADTRAWLQGHRVANETLLTSDGQPLTIGDAKRFLRMRCFAFGLDESNTIFAIGRDAGVPHSRGNEADPIMLGKTIIFDIFPRLNGYYADITRTWCLGYAPDYVQQAYEHVMQVHASTEQKFSTERYCWEMQENACTLFEAFGHKTQRQDLAATSGYLHGLGHGFGLAVHESPGMSLRGMRPDEKFQIGTIICNEPGLYYPDDPRGGWGVRIEDDYWCNFDGTFQRLTEFDRSLVVPM